MTDPHKPFQRLDDQASIDQPHVPNGAGHDYGMRVGFWRLKAALNRHGITPTLAISGVSHRIGWFERALAHMAERPGTLFWQGKQIMNWYRAAPDWAAPDWAITA